MISSRAADRAATAVLWSLAGAAVLLLVAVVLSILWDALPVLSPSFLVADPSFTEVGGVGPVIWNSVYLLVLTMAITMPLGILGGIYMAEYAGGGRLPQAIRFAQESIASIPSIVVGLFGLIVFVNLFGIGFSALAGALALTLFNLPLLARLVENSLREVPEEDRAASFALGATHWQTIQRIILPGAVPGIVTGTILTAGRVFGEAAALIFTAGLATPFGYDFTNFNLLDPTSPWSPFRPATTLSVFIWKTNTEGLNPHAADIASGAAAILLLFVLAFNVASRQLGRYLDRRLTGGHVQR